MQGGAHTRRCIDKAGHAQGSAYTRWYIHKAVHAQGSAYTRQSVATTEILLFKGGAGAGPSVKRTELRCTMCVGRVGGAHTRQCIHKGVHAQGGADTRWGTHQAVSGHHRRLVFQGGAMAGPRIEQREPSVERSELRCTMRVGTVGGTHTRRCIRKAVHTRGGAYTRRGMHKAVHTQGSAYTRQCTHKAVHPQGSAYTRQCTHKAVHTQGGAYTRRCIHKAVRTQGGAHTRRSVATARALLFQGGAGVGPRVKRTELRCTMCVGRVGDARTRRCIHKLGHTPGGLWPPQASCYFRGCEGWPPH